MGGKNKQKGRRKLMGRGATVFDMGKGSVRHAAGCCCLVCKPGSSYAGSTSTTYRRELKFELDNIAAPLPHKFETKVNYICPIPTVFFSELALEKMRLIVDACPEEVSWLGVAETDGSDYIVEDIFLLEQEVSSVETEMSTAGLEKLTMQLLALPNGADMVNKLRFWGHSHVNMGTSPSGQDDKQVELWEKNGHDFMIRAIMNKSSKLQLSVFNFKTGLSFHDSPWGMLGKANEELEKSVIKELQEKVKKPTYTSTTYTPGTTTAPAGNFSDNGYHGCGSDWKWGDQKGMGPTDVSTKALSEGAERMKERGGGGVHTLTDQEFQEHYDRAYSG